MGEIPRMRRSIIACQVALNHGECPFILSSAWARCAGNDRDLVFVPHSFAKCTRPLERLIYRTADSSAIQLTIALALITTNELDTWRKIV